MLELDCSFTASVRTNAERVAVGQFGDKGLHWNRDAAQLGSRARDKTDATMRRLYQSVAATRLVPGCRGVEAKPVSRPEAFGSRASFCVPDAVAC